MPAEIRPRNEAAERLRASLHHVGPPFEDDLDAALAEERRRVVARIRERISRPRYDLRPEERWLIKDLLAILDEVEADR
jgi:hypothetical protein